MLERIKAHALTIRPTFFYACKTRDLKEIKRYIEEGKDIHANGVNIHALDDYALCNASSNGHLELVKILLEAGANVHAKDDAALRWAYENGHLEVVDLLKKHGAKLPN
jgi:ankyrin repeat protein